MTEPLKDIEELQGNQKSGVRGVSDAVDDLIRPEALGPWQWEVTGHPQGSNSEEDGPGGRLQGAKEELQAARA